MRLHAVLAFSLRGEGRVVKNARRETPTTTPPPLLLLQIYYYSRRSCSSGILRSLGCYRAIWKPVCLSHRHKDAHTEASSARERDYTILCAAAAATDSRTTNFRADASYPSLSATRLHFERSLERDIYREYIVVIQQTQEPTPLLCIHLCICVSCYLAASVYIHTYIYTKRDRNTHTNCHSDFHSARESRSIHI